MLSGDVRGCGPNHPLTLLTNLGKLAQDPKRGEDGQGMWIHRSNHSENLSYYGHMYLLWELSKLDLCDGECNRELEGSYYFKREM